MQIKLRNPPCRNTCGSGPIRLLSLNTLRHTRKTFRSQVRVVFQLARSSQRVVARQTRPYWPEAGSSIPAGAGTEVYMQEHHLRHASKASAYFHIPNSAIPHRSRHCFHATFRVRIKRAQPAAIGDQLSVRQRKVLASTSSSHSCHGRRRFTRPAAYTTCSVWRASQRRPHSALKQARILIDAFARARFTR